MAFFQRIIQSGSGSNMSQIELIQVTLKLSESFGFLYEEVPSYSTGHLVSDIGGALGLVLGLSILDCLVFEFHFNQ